MGAGPSRLAVWSPSGLPLPLLLRETVGPHELIDRDWTQRGGAGEGGREGGTERVLTSPFSPLEKHFTFVDTASLESRRPRLAARRDPRLVVFEKSRDFATLYILVLIKLLLFVCFVFFYFEGRNKLDMFSCACTPTYTHSHTSKHQLSRPLYPFVTHCRLLSCSQLSTEGWCHRSPVQSGLGAS